ncbi:MAG: phosphopantothenoylcysteine decarboxylase, partial [Clostridia bacterium]|nr:phosphopantothenoylcysteine decarboxylase [Clostridia bacterium]
VQAAQKIKKNVENLFIELEKNPDILAELGAKKKKQVLVGFAAETQDLLQYAADKVVRKNLDFIAANDVTQPGAGFAAETNIVTLVFANGAIRTLPQLSKDETAGEILREAIKLLP